MTPPSLDPDYRAYWILDPERRVIATDLLGWARWFETGDRRVADDRTAHVRVSTVFLGINHRFIGDGPPLLFETMGFARDGGDCLDDLTRRYASWDDAVTGHQAALRRVRRWERLATGRLERALRRATTGGGHPHNH